LPRFANAMESHKALDAHYTELLTTGKVDTPGGFKYSYGFGARTKNGARFIDHNGGVPGMYGDLEIPEWGHVIASWPTWTRGPHRGLHRKPVAG
jgi:hypothetical protein